MKKTLLLPSLILAVCMMGPTPSGAVPRVSLTASGVYSHAFPDHDWTMPDEMRNGMGGYGLLEWRVSPGLALGVGSGMVFYKGGGMLGTTSAVDGLGRLIPWHGEKGEFYLIGGLGYNVLVDQRADVWPGHYHATAGFGFRKYFSSAFALDWNAVYSLYSPKDTKLNSGDVRLGFTLGVGKVPMAAKPKEEAKPTPTAEATPAQKAEEATSVEVESAESAGETVAGEEATAEVAVAEEPVAKPRAREVRPVYDAEVAESGTGKAAFRVPERRCLVDVAWDPQVYGDGALYPLLVDANRGRINADGTVDAGVELMVPRNLTKARMKSARDNAWSRKYLPYSGRKLNYTRYAKWRETKADSREYGVKKHRVRRGDTLWDLAYTYYRDNWMWPTLFHANLDQLVDQHHIYPGQVLVVPQVPSTPKKRAPAPKSFVPAGEQPAEDSAAEPEAETQAEETTAEPAGETKGTGQPAEKKPADTGDLLPDEM